MNDLMMNVTSLNIKMRCNGHPFLQFPEDKDISTKSPRVSEKISTMSCTVLQIPNCQDTKVCVTDFNVDSTLTVGPNYQSFPHQFYNTFFKNDLLLYIN